ncbi:hypothetical protein [Thermodesulfovibrio yellowstonii]|uniref:hypothetical protein n=1 Tax=Thermodesulfovibrio yellowstonii TaxID=28262 RepID=UPI0024B34B40|nr:hypothetical protein [Thermodesulfovibrio yellowstonii]MDI6864625.1 hypothetical protein [Thermodesulfovibrio yellowstonii]
MNEKAFAIANALAKYYGIPEPEFASAQECHAWIKSVLNKSNAQLRKCPHCQTVMARKLVYGRLRYVCKACNKNFALKGV